MTPRATGGDGAADPSSRVMTFVLRVSAALLASGLGCWLAGAAPRLEAALLSAGILLLLSAPILRVMVVAVSAKRAGDQMMALMATVVLVVVGVTLAIAWGV